VFHACKNQGEVGTRRRHCSVSKSMTAKYNAGEDEPVNVDEVPDPRDADGVPVAGRADERRNIAGIVFGGPEAVARDFERREADPLASRRAVVVEIETGMIHQDGKAAANEHGDEEEVEEMAVTDPEREPVRALQSCWDISAGRVECAAGRPRQSQSRPRRPADEEWLKSHTMT
jgi:hypothetical protein